MIKFMFLKVSVLIKPAHRKNALFVTIGIFLKRV